MPVIVGVAAGGALFDSHDAAGALAYTVASVVTGIAAVYLGEHVGRVL